MEDKITQAQLNELNARLEGLENMVRVQIARTYAIERKLGIVPPQIQFEPLAPPPPPAPTPAPSMLPALPAPPAVRLDDRGVPIGVSAAPVPPRAPQATPPASSAMPAATPAVQRSITASDKATVTPNGMAGAGADASSAETSASTNRRKQGSWEDLIGGTWFSRIGILAIVLGMGYFLREAFQRGWIPPEGRVALGVLVGMGLLAGGEKLRGSGYRAYAQILSGGGLAVLYLAFFSAFAIYHLIGQLPAFLLAVLVTTTAVLLAVRYDALALAIIGLLGGLLTPLLLSTGTDNQVGLFSYIISLNLGVLAVAYFKRWRTLNYLAFLGTAFLSSAWYVQWYRDEKLWTTMFFFTALFVLFALLAIFHNVINQRPTTRLDLSLIFTNATLYFAAAHGLLNQRYHPYMGLFAVAVAAFYLGLGYLAYTRNRSDQYLILTFVGLATLFLTLAIPIQLEQHWVSIGWAMEGAVLTWIGVRAASMATCRAAILIFGISLFRWFEKDYDRYQYDLVNSFTPLINNRSLAALFISLALGYAAHLLRSFPLAAAAQTPDDEAKPVSGLAAFAPWAGVPVAHERNVWRNCLMAAAHFLTVTWLTADLHDWFARRIELLGDFRNAPDGWPQWWEDARQRLTNWREFAQTVLWSVYATAALWWGLQRNVILLRFGALGLFALTALKLLFAETGYFDATWHRLVFNPSFGSYVVFVASLALSAWLYARSPLLRTGATTGLVTGSTNDLAARFWPILPLGAVFFLLLGMSLEAYGHFAALMQEVGYDSPRWDDLRLGQQLSLSVIWALYGGGLLAAGIARRHRVLRLLGIGLLLITIAKVFLFDLSSLDTIYRVLSFIVLGVILLVVSFFYQRMERRNGESV